MGVSTGFEAELVSELFKRLPHEQDREMAERWAAPHKKKFREAWGACPRGSWLLWMAWNSPLERRRVAGAAGDCALLALQLMPQGREFLRPLLMTLRAWARGSESESEAVAAVKAAINKADDCRRLAEESTVSREQNVFLLYALAALCVARVAEDIVTPENSSETAYWPTTASLALLIYGRSKGDGDARSIEEFDGILAEAIRGRIKPEDVPEMIGQSSEDPNTYLEVAFDDTQSWEQFESVWLAVGKAKMGEALDADDKRWMDFPGVSGDNFAEFSVVLEMVRDGAYAFGSTELLEANTARLSLDEAQRPLSDVEELIRFVNLFGLRLRAIGDGITRRLLQ